MAGLGDMTAVHEQVRVGVRVYPALTLTLSLTTSVTLTLTLILTLILTNPNPSPNLNHEQPLAKRMGAATKAGLAAIAAAQPVPSKL